MTPSILHAQNLSAAGITHGFTNRLGGFSSGSFDSFNLSKKVGDDPVQVDKNLNRLFELSRIAPTSLVELHQVHGGDVLVLEGRPTTGEKLRYDASCTNQSDLALRINTADCVPILMGCKEARAVAAVHAGWRGCLNRIVVSTVERMQRFFGCRPKDIIAAIGPCIHWNRFEVGSDVFHEFGDAFGDLVARRRGDGLHVDLVEANRLLLDEAGVGQIEVVDLCTHQRADLFFSHRRDKGHTGRQMAYIALST